MEAALSLAQFLSEEASSIEFPDHSAGAPDNSWACLADMSDPDRAGNNCHAATHALIEHVITSYGLDAETNIYPVETLFADGCHWFAVLDVNGDRWAVDVTARQFDATVAAIEVTPLPEHLRRVNTWMQSQYQDAIHTVHIFDGNSVDEATASTLSAADLAA